MELKCEMKLSFVGLVFATYTIDRRDAWKDNEGTEYMSAKEILHLGSLYSASTTVVWRPW